MILDWLEEWFKGVLIDGITSNLTGLFDTVNGKVGEIAADVGATPQGWNSGIFNMLRSLSETVIVPIAGAILALIMCYELIQLIAERNSMHDMDSWMLFRWVFKSAAVPGGIQSTAGQQGYSAGGLPPDAKPPHRLLYHRHRTR